MSGKKENPTPKKEKKRNSYSVSLYLVLRIAGSHTISHRLVLDGHSYFIIILCALFVYTLQPCSTFSLSSSTPLSLLLLPLLYSLLFSLYFSFFCRIPCNFQALQPLFLQYQGKCWREEKGPDSEYKWWWARSDWILLCKRASGIWPSSHRIDCW